MGIKLKKVMSELNIGLQTAIEILKDHKSLGDIGNDAGKGTVISEEQYNVLAKMFKGGTPPADEARGEATAKQPEDNGHRPPGNKETGGTNDKAATESDFGECVTTWLQFRKTGRAKEAHDYYRNHLFGQVIKRFVAKEWAGLELQTDVLISFLGYSPEPVILAERLLIPKRHIILHDKNLRDNMDNDRFLNDFPNEDRSIVEIPQETFGSIYDTLKEQVAINPATNYTINITGGKKSMAASAGIFGRDFGCDIIYIDYDNNSYDPDIRVPLPGHERLNWVYSPLRDLPELFHLPH